jgi:hypothetical protein
MKALAFKELREIRGIVLGALGAYLALVVNLMGARVFDWVPVIPAGTNEVPFTAFGFMVFFTLVSVVFAVWLGFRQSAGEAARGTYLFLLHRPLARDTIFAIKLAVGGGVLLACAALPILLYGWWAAIPGHHPGPFAWSMTAAAWRMMLLMPLLYLGAFLSGLRPARWLGTRLLPLAGMAALVVGLVMLPWWWAVGLPLTLVLAALLVTNICFVARVRDYA